MSADAHRRCIFVRHGQTEWNAQGRYQGRTDIPLCTAGIAEARRAGATLQRARASLVLTSPLRRARATAEIISRCAGSLPCHADERLVELGFGEWEGSTQAEIKRRWPEQLRQWKQAPHSFRFPGGEGLVDALRRLEDFLDRPPWDAAEAHRCIIVVTHTAPIRLARLCAEGRPLAQYRQVPLPDGAALELDWDPRGRLCLAGHDPLT
jgi:probable phosphoglycerate mutase